MAEAMHEGGGQDHLSHQVLTGRRRSIDDYPGVSVTDANAIRTLAPDPNG
jgi:hypothetical protein